MSTSLNTPSKWAAVNASAVSSAVLTSSALATGASFAALTAIVAVADADSASDWSATLKSKLASPFQFATGVKVSVPRSNPRDHSGRRHRRPVQRQLTVRLVRQAHHAYRTQAVTRVRVAEHSIELRRGERQRYILGRACRKGARRRRVGCRTHRDRSRGQRRLRVRLVHHLEVEARIAVPVRRRREGQRPQVGPRDHVAGAHRRPVQRQLTVRRRPAGSPPVPPSGCHRCPRPLNTALEVARAERQRRVLRRALAQRPRRRRVVRRAHRHRGRRRRRLQRPTGPPP